MKRIEIARLPKLDFSATEAMNTLATNLSYCGDHVQKIMVTSRYAFEGKSFVTMNLMRTMASLQKRTVLLDTDLRCSRFVTNYEMRFSDNEHWGLAHYLAGMCGIEDIIYETNIENGFFIPAGRKVSSSLQLLSSERMAALMQRLGELFDVVLIDTPPVGVIVDALEVAKYCDGSLIVVAYNRGRRKDLSEITSSIKMTGCQVYGAVLNNVDFGSLTSKKYYYSSERYSAYYQKKNSYNTYQHANREKKTTL